MSLTAALPSASIHPNSLQEVHTSMNEAERDIRLCLRQVGQCPLAESDRACKEMGKRIAGIEANLKALTSDEDTLESFHDLTRDLRCLMTRVSISSRQTPAALMPSSLPTKVPAAAPANGAVQITIPKAASNIPLAPELTTPAPDSTQPQLTANFERLAQKLSTIKFTPVPKDNWKINYENFGVYVTSNELNQAWVRHALKKMEQIPNGVHLGLSGLYNWDLIAQMNSSFAILIDFNPRVAVFNNKMLSILCRANNPQEFVTQAVKQMESDLSKDDNFYQNNILYSQFGLCEFPLHNPIRYQDMSPLERHEYELKAMLAKNNGALSNENFPILQKMAKEGRIVSMHLDLCDTAAISTIAEAVHAEGLQFSSLYVSNCYDYFEKIPEAKQAFKQSMATLVQDNTCIVDTSFIGNVDFSNGRCVIDSFIHYGKDPETGNPYNPDITREWLLRENGGGDWVDTKKVDVSTYYKKPPLS